MHGAKIKMGKKTYLHPELYERYKEGHLDTIVNGFKENTFALGLMILELAFNIDMDDWYSSQYHLLKSKADQTGGT